MDLEKDVNDQLKRESYKQFCTTEK